MVGVLPPSCALLGGSAIDARVALLRQHSANAERQRVLVLAVCLGLFFWFRALDQDGFPSAIQRTLSISCRIVS